MTTLRLGKPNQIISFEVAKTFRGQYFNAMLQEFIESYSGVVSLLDQQEFQFPSMNRAHSLQMRHSLLARQAIPFMVTLRALDEVGSSHAPTLAAVIAAHTLTLTHLDYHLDGAPPREDNSATAIMMRPETAVSYAVRMSFRSAAMLSSLPFGHRIISEAIDDVSGFVLERMHEDWCGRFKTDILDDPQASYNDYIKSKESRLLGSGYWDVMLRSAHISARPTLPLPENLIAFASNLRRLRQLVDELHDACEDIESGVITLPTLVRCINDDRFRRNLCESWDQGATIENLSPLSSDVIAIMLDLISAEIRNAHEAAACLGAEEFHSLVDVKAAKAVTVAADLGFAMRLTRRD